MNPKPIAFLIVFYLVAFVLIVFWGEKFLGISTGIVCPYSLPTMGKPLLLLLLLYTILYIIMIVIAIIV